MEKFPDRLTLDQARRAGCLIEDLDLGDYSALVDLAHAEARRAEKLLREDASRELPDGFLGPQDRMSRDPRSGDLAVFCPGRNLRSFRKLGRFCIVEDREISPIFAYRKLSGSDRFCFCNLNMFPILLPGEKEAKSADELLASGLHFLFWPSNVHVEDLDRLTVADGVIGLKLMADLELACLTGAAGRYPRSGEGAAGDHYGWFRIIRNLGALVGGSVDHPHLQLLHGASPDGHLLRDRAYFEQKGSGFAADLIATVPPENIVADYGEAVWLIPPFARRALHSIICLRGGGEYLYELTDPQLAALAQALGDYTCAVPKAMKRLDRTPAHNLVFHSGPIGGCYVEALALTQETGGYELAGLWVNLQTSSDSARMFREELKAKV